MNPISADFPYESKYVEVLGSRMHYVEEGEGDPILFLHGNPTSSYLWRNIIPYARPHGRAIAIDLIGMGLSDKPDIEYRFADHSAYVNGFIEALGLTNITFVIHDWGSALGFHYAREHESNVRGLAFMEAIVAPIPGYDVMPVMVRAMFKSFRTKAIGWKLIVDGNIFIEKVLPMGTKRKLTDEEMDRYRAPYLDPPSRKPLWRWPNEISIGGEPADVTATVNAYNAWLQQSELAKLLLYARPGIILPEKTVLWCRENLPNLTTVDIGEGAHYIQEDHPEAIGQALSDWLAQLDR